ncbi:type VII secretion protein EssC [Bacillus gobiensis]|uniref:type VII secretion protein EssC n=1 Tax=Bacillus gobiensis TaxID=1441095 RepID=UPI003D1A7FAB
MDLLWVFNDQGYQSIKLTQKPARTYTIGPDLQQTITIRSFPFEKGIITLEPNNSSDGYYLFEGEESLGSITENQPFLLKNKNKQMTIILTEDKDETSLYYLGDKKDIRFSTDDKEKASFYKGTSPLFSAEKGGFSLLHTNGRWHVLPENQEVYVNGIKCTAPAPIESGDELFWEFTVFKLIENDLLEVLSYEPYETTLERSMKPSSEMKKKYPLFRRTPRMIYELPKEKVTFTFPYQENDYEGRSFWIIIMPPLVMLIVIGIVALIQPRGFFIIVSIMMFITTLITSSAQYFRERTQKKQREEKRKRVYKLYLENKRKELQELSDKQKSVLSFHFPRFERMKFLTKEIDSRIWEKSLESADFLQIRLGTGDVEASYQISMNGGDLAHRDTDELLEQTQEMEKVYKKVKNVPVTVNLAEGPMGVVGKESIVKNELHQLIGQLAFFHSYHDLRLIFIFDENEYKDWEWMKWLPHFQLPNSYAKGFIYNEQTRDQILSSVYETLRERDLEDDKEKLLFKPHFVFIITNYQLISEHVILEYLEGEPKNLGLSMIMAADTKESLPEHIYTLVRYINDREGDILIEQKKAVQIPFALDQHSKKGNETFSRTLRTLNHLVGMTNSIPNMVSFLELFHTRDVNEIGIKEKWASSESAKSLSVPIGYKGKDDLVYLNLHEKAHGPHGLLAGTTGSGKSEFLQTYLLSLAVHFHPHEVAFLLIDYKGGGMAQPFKNIPHLLGTITNIEGSKNFSIRALASIKSELKKRQRLFDQFKVNHINDYTKLYKGKIAQEAMPHLFLISDEFAELKNEEPEFIRELVSAARIGRSLGVHLILATQKPGGIIDNQIWSNSRFKIALKVQDAQDSKEILKNSDAASITVTGRGYLQVGNNEVYELFQSAWSGAPYMEDRAGTEDEIAIVTDTGLIPLSGVTAESQAQKNSQIEIEAVTEEIERVQEELGIKRLPSPWLPPLEERIAKMLYKSNKKEVFHIAYVDEPDLQKQAPYPYQIMEDGNIGIFGSSGYGKSMTVTTLLMSFAEEYSPEELHYYIFDFGNASLLPLAQLPHTADYFLLDQKRKMEKFMRFVKDEIEHRKKLFRQKEMSHIKLYNALAEDELPIIFLVLDNFDVVKEEMYDYEQEFIKFSRDGQSLGIYLIVSATRVNAVRQSLMNNLKTKIVHYLMDQTEAYGVIGKPKFSLEPIPGRVIIKKDASYFAQVFLPVEADDDIELFDELKAQVQQIRMTYEDREKPKAIPMLPSELSMHDFEEKYVPSRKEYGFIPLGLDEESVQPVYMALAKTKHCIVMGQTQKGKTNVIKLMLRYLLDGDTQQIGVFDSIDRGLTEFTQEEKIKNIETKEEMKEWLTQNEEVFKTREAMYLEAVQHREVQNLSFASIVLVIDGFGRFQQSIDASIQDKITSFIRSYAHLGFHLIVSGNASEFSKGYDSLTTEVKQVRQAVLLMKKSDQNMIPLPYDRQETEIQPGYGYLIENGKERKIQIPLCSKERKKAI